MSEMDVLPVSCLTHSIRGVEEAEASDNCSVLPELPIVFLSNWLLGLNGGYVLWVMG